MIGMVELEPTTISSPDRRNTGPSRIHPENRCIQQWLFISNDIRIQYVGNLL
jgi:hypothetical protein